MTYFWLGGMGLDRLAEYGSLISIIIVAVLLPILKNNKRKLLVFIVCGALISSVYAYVEDESEGHRFISYQEQDGGQWMSENNTIKDVDSQVHCRLSGILVSKGFLSTQGVYEGSDSPNVDLNDIYYGNNSINLLNGLK